MMTSFVPKNIGVSAMVHVTTERPWFQSFAKYAGHISRHFYYRIDVFLVPLSTWPSSTYKPWFKCTAVGQTEDPSELVE